VDPESQAAQATDLIALLKDRKQTAAKSQPPREYQIAINLVVADQLNIQIPDALLGKAKYVFRAEK
jgi:ABC-type uncharacterized transport system substrate-binding protein